MTTETLGKAPRFRRMHAQCWWLPGGEIGMPFTLALLIPCGLLSIVMALVFDASIFASVMVAIAPLLVALAVFFPGATLRIARVQRSESLLLLPDRARHLRIALLSLIACMLIPLLLIALFARHPAPLVFGMFFITAMLLGYWQQPLATKAANDRQWGFFIFGVAPMIALTQSEMLGLVSKSVWPLLITGSIALGSILWRNRQIGRASAMPGAWSWPVSVRLSVSAEMLKRVGLVLGAFLFYAHFLKSSGTTIFIVLMLFSVDNPAWLRSKLRLRWLNGMDREELFASGILAALRDQLLAGLLVAAGASIMFWFGWLDARWVASLLIAMMFAAPVILMWQLVAIATMQPVEDGSETMRRKLVRATPMLVTLPLTAGLIFAADLSKDLLTFSAYCLALSAVLTSVGFPIACKKFQRIEL